MIRGAIPILPPLMAVLKKVPRAIHDDHVFLYRGLPLKDIRNGFIKAMQDAKIPYGRGTRKGTHFP